MRIPILSMVVVPWLVASWAHADVETIDEAKLVAAIEAGDPRIARGVAEIAAVRARAVAAHARPNPSVSIDREEPYADGRGLPTNYLRLTLPIDVSGRRGLGIAAADSDVRAQQSATARDRFAVVIDGLHAFEEAAYARRHADALAAERASLVRAAEIVRTRGKTGDASGYEVQRVELELAAYDDLIGSAQIELLRHRQRLASLVGRPGIELDAASGLGIPSRVPAADALLAGALDARTDHQAARFRLEASQHRLHAAARGWMPVPTLTAGAMTTDVGDRTATGYVAALSLTIPLFDHGQAERAQAIAARQLAEADARWIEIQLPQQVRTAHGVLAARIEQADRLATSQLDRLDTMVAAAEAAFREGNANIAEVLDAHRAARDARLRALELRHQAALALLDLELALGHRL